MEPMKPMKPMAPMKPMQGGEAWWPRDLGKPASSGAQGGQRYAFFPDARRLLIEKAGQITRYATGDHRITGVAQGDGGGEPLAFTGEHGPVRLDDLERLD